MTAWDEIYKNHNNGGEAWATLSEGIIPRFVELIEKGNFPIHDAFDIGCGTGKYLLFLKSKGFKVNGIDSSPTAVEMTEKALGQENIECGDMFSYDIEKESKDLLLSVSTIHHGTKDKVKDLIDHVYKWLVPQGKVFITLPDIKSALERDEFESHKEISPMTYVPLGGPEEGLPHSFYEKPEIEELFGKFKNVEISLDEIGRWVIVGEK